jgi:hypothetical protein
VGPFITGSYADRCKPPPSGSGQSCTSALGRELTLTARSSLNYYKKGLWADPQPVPPWEWRKGKESADRVGEKCCEINKWGNRVVSHRSAAFYLCLEAA